MKKSKTSSFKHSPIEKGKKTHDRDLVKDPPKLFHGFDAM